MTTGESSPAINVSPYTGFLVGTGVGDGSGVGVGSGSGIGVFPETYVILPLYSEKATGISISP